MPLGTATPVVREQTYVFETTALVVFQETMAAAEVAFAEAAVTDNALSGFLALLGTAADLLSRHDCELCGVV